MTTNIFTQKKIRLEYLEDLYRLLEDREQSLNSEWAPTGEQEPAWDYKNDCAKTDEDGNTIMRDKYGYRPKTEEEYSEEDMARLSILADIKKQLEKMM